MESKANLDRRYHHPVRMGDILFLGMLVGIIIWQLPATPGDPKVNLEQLISAGLDDHFLHEMVALLQPDRSALLFFIPRSSLIDERQLRDSLNEYEGRCIRQHSPTRL